MAVMNLNENKIIKKFKDISEIVNAVTEKAYDKDLDNKRILSFFLEEDNFNKSLYKLTKSEDDLKLCEGFTFQDFKNENLFYIILKQNSLFEILPVYFHELGHVANYNLKLTSTDLFVNSVLNECLAISYAYWAADMTKEVTKLDYIDSSIRLNREIKLQRLAENFNYKPMEYNISFELLHTLNQIFRSMKETYFWLKDSAKNNKKKLYDLISKTSIITKKCYIN